MKYLITLIFLITSLNISAQETAKIYTEGNYLFIEIDDRIYEGLRKEVLVKKLLITSTEFYFENVNNFPSNKGIELADIVDATGTPYTAGSWETFYTTETGNSNGGGSGEGLQVVPLWVNNSSGGVYAVDDIINYSGDLYRNLTGTNTDITPNLDVTNWKLLEEFLSVYDSTHKL
jgi:hypothetical protein